MSTLFFRFFQKIFCSLNIVGHMGNNPQYMRLLRTFPIPDRGEYGFYHEKTLENFFGDR